MTVSWLLAALGLVLSGPGPVASRPRRLTRRPALSPGGRRRLAGVAVCLGCVSMLGWERGALAATVAVPVALTVLHRVEHAPARGSPSPDLALVLDLVAVALRAGRPLEQALVLAARADEGPDARALTRVGGLLRLGADASDAWSAVAGDPVLGPVAAAGVRSASSGVRLAAEFEALAADVRAQLHAAAHSRAARAGVLVAAPLGLCFLPSFVCLGIVPTVVGIARSVFA